MRIYGIGLSRTGTTSLNQALYHLGYGSYHTNCLIDPTRYQSMTDTVPTYFYRQLYEFYPDSKFILTVRDVDDWLRSWAKHDRNLTLKESVAWMRYLIYGQTNFDPEVWRQVYFAHVREVQRAIEPERLLVLNLCTNPSWKPLCEFLGVSIPDVEFPHLNKFSDAFPHLGTGGESFIKSN
jgi:hypothetical protein